MDTAAARQQIREKYIADLEKQRLTQKRNKYIIDLKALFKKHIYNERIKEYNAITERLIIENAILLGDVTPTFVYRGVRYALWSHQRQLGENKLVHPDMLEKIRLHIDNEDFDAEVEEGKIMNYVGKALVTARCKYDLFELIPERLCQPLHQLNQEVFDIGHPMSDQEISQFKAENKTGIIAFNRLFLEQLLLA